MSTRRSFLARFTGFVAAALVVPRLKAEAKPINFSYRDVAWSHGSDSLTLVAGRNITLTTSDGYGKIMITGK